jgi:glyoxylase-like metal-dependent hydrolase (beta-lactamase superfamily II)
LHDLLQNDGMEEIAPGVMHWQAPHPRIGVDVSSYWLPQLRTLLDPLDVPEEVDGVQHILLSCRHHLRDSLEVRTRFGAVVRAPRAGMHEFDEDTPVVPYDIGESLAGGAVTVYEVNAISPDECAFHIPSVNALAIADGAIRYGDDLHFVPDEYMDDPEDTKAALKAAYRRLADELDFDNLLPAHGAPIVGGARERLREFATA